MKTFLALRSSRLNKAAHRSYCNGRTFPSIPFSENGGEGQGGEAPPKRSQILGILTFLPLCLLLAASVVGCNKSSTPEGTTADAIQASNEEMDSTPFVLEKALEQAKAENKPVLLEFTGSDWCPPCQMLERNVLSTSEFKEYKEKNLIFGKLDFPSRKPQSDAVKDNNQSLQQKFQIEGYPTLILLNGEGKELWRQVGVPQDISNPKGFIAAINSRKQ